MKSGSDSSEARCSSNEGGCGCVAMIFLHYVKEWPSENRFVGSEGRLSLGLTGASEIRSGQRPEFPHICQCRFNYSSIHGR